MTLSVGELSRDMFSFLPDLRRGEERVSEGPALCRRIRPRLVVSASGKNGSTTAGSGVPSRKAIRADLRMGVPEALLPVGLTSTLGGRGESRASSV